MDSFAFLELFLTIFPPFYQFSILSEMNFIMVGEFPLHDARLRRSYNCKLFAFNTCLIYTERKSRKQLLRGIFMLPDVCFVAKSKSFVLCNKQRECEFFCHQPAIVQKWEAIVCQLLGESMSNKPDELVKDKEKGENKGEAGEGGGEEASGGKEAGEGSGLATRDVAESSRTKWYTLL